MEPVAGVSEVGRQLRPEMGTLFEADWRTHKHRIEASNGKRVRSGGAAKEYKGHEQF